MLGWAYVVATDAWRASPPKKKQIIITIIYIYIYTYMYIKKIPIKPN